MIAGLLKAFSSHPNPVGGVLHGPAALAAVMREHGVLPAPVLEGPSGWVLTTLVIATELTLGAGLVLARGRAGKLAAGGAAGLLLIFQVYLAAVAFLAERDGTNVACWCFGGLGGTTPAAAMLRNALLIACLVPGLVWPARSAAWRAVLPLDRG